MPDRVRELVENGRGPAEHLISLLDSEEDTDLAAVERRPLPEVIATLDRLGTNHAAGLERIREILDPEAVEALRASAASLWATSPEITRFVEEHSKGRVRRAPPRREAHGGLSADDAAHGEQGRRRDEYGREPATTWWRAFCSTP